jgi:hypothetical protein
MEGDPVHEAKLMTDESADATTDRGIGRRHLGWLAVLAVVLLPLAIIDGPARSALERWGWVDRDQQFTELYFPDHLALPDRALAGEPLRFEFSVRNREGASRTYRWEVVIGRSGTPATGGAIAAGELQVGHDEVRVVAVEPIIDLPPGDAVVTVALVGRREAIHFPVVVDTHDGATPPP